MFVYTKIPCIVFRVAPGSWLARKLLVLFYFLKLYREAGMDIDARLGVVPTAATTIGEAACLRATIIRIFGIEDIIDLT